MACAALKRILELENLKKCPAKKMRMNYFESLCHDDNLTSAVPQPSSFVATLAPGTTQGQMTPNNSQEAMRLYIHQQLNLSANVNGQMQGTHTNEHEMETDVPSDTAGSSEVLFTFEQVEIFCEDMLQQKETAIREEYEQALKAKLEEQYDTFVRFTFDQMQKHHEPILSYIS